MALLAAQELAERGGRRAQRNALVELHVFAISVVSPMTTPAFVREEAVVVVAGGSEEEDEDEEGEEEEARRSRLGRITGDIR